MNKEETWYVIETRNGFSGLNWEVISKSSNEDAAINFIKRNLVSGEQGRVVKTISEVIYIQDGP